VENWNWETIFYGYYRSCSLLFKFGILRFWAPFGGLGTTYDVHLGLIGKHVVDFRFPVTFGQNLSTQQSHCLFATAKLLVKLLSLVGWNYSYWDRSSGRQKLTKLLHGWQLGVTCVILCIFVDLDLFLLIS